MPFTVELAPAHFPPKLTRPCPPSVSEDVRSHPWGSGRHEPRPPHTWTNPRPSLEQAGAPQVCGFPLNGRTCSQGGLPGVWRAASGPRAQPWGHRRGLRTQLRGGALGASPQSLGKPGLGARPHWTAAPTGPPAARPALRISSHPKHPCRTVRCGMWPSLGRLPRGVSPHLAN